MPKKPKQRMEDMNAEHMDLIQKMIGKGNKKIKSNGIVKRNGRVAHEFRIDGIPYYIILAG